MLAGCAAPQTRALLEEQAEPRPSAAQAPLPPRIELAKVPFFPQEDYQCGPASLAETLAYSGVAATPESLLAQVYIPDRQGSLQAEMLAATRRHGRVAYRVGPTLPDLLREVAGGTPVLVLQNLAFGFAPVWHYAVVVGYDLAREEIVLRSGVTERLAMTLSNFERVWARSGYWAMAALPPGRLPASPDAGEYAQSVAALERVDARAARRAYEAGLARWPDNLLLAVGAGNTAYAAHDYSAAARAYQRATEAHPASGDAWNNLAQALLDLGRRDEARAAAQRAVDIGGPRIANYRSTLEAAGRAP